MLIEKAIVCKKEEEENPAKPHYSLPDQLQVWTPRKKNP